MVSSWMASGGVLRTAALGLVLRLLLSLGLGLEAAPAQSPAQVLGTHTVVGQGEMASHPGQDSVGLGSKPGPKATSPPGSGKDADSRLSAALRGSAELRVRVAYSWAEVSVEGSAVVPAQAHAHRPDFQCRLRGYCVPLTWHCDGDQDCPDGSDEEECNREPCTQDGQCAPPIDSPCSCDRIEGCENSPNCSSQPCPAGELRCLQGSTCVPHTWFCDGHADCPDSSDELGCGTETIQEDTPVTHVTLSSVTYLRNTTATLGRDQDSVQSRNRSAYGIIAAAAVLSVGLVATILLVLSQLCAKGLRHPLKLLLERKTSPL